MATVQFANLEPIAAGGDTGIPQHITTTPGSKYNGPTMNWLIANQKLAHQIIATHQRSKPDGDILDDEELRLLARYVADPSADGVERLFRELGLFNEEAGRVDEARVMARGSLVLFAIVGGAAEGVVWESCIRPRNGGAISRRCNGLCRG